MAYWNMTLFPFAVFERMDLARFIGQEQPKQMSMSVSNNSAMIDSLLFRKFSSKSIAQPPGKASPKNGIIKKAPAAYITMI